MTCTDCPVPSECADTPRCVGVGGFAPSIQTVEQLRPHEAYPELVEVIRLIEMHDGNPVWLAKLRNEIDASLATERNTSYYRGWEDAGESDDATSAVPMSTEEFIALHDDISLSQV